MKAVARAGESRGRKNERSESDERGTEHGHSSLGFPPGGGAENEFRRNLPSDSETVNPLSEL